MKSLNQMANESLSVCDGCSNWRICKFSEDVKRAEAEYKQLRESANWPECVETTIGCKYKQFVVNRLNNYNDNDYVRYNDSDYTKTGWSSNAPVNSDGAPIGSIKIT